MMPSFAALAVSALYCFWGHYRRHLERQRRIRVGVARLLWAAAMGDDDA
jgi:hypothetical protein